VQKLKFIVFSLAMVLPLSMLSISTVANEQISPISQVPALKVISGWLPYWDDSVGADMLISNNDLTSETMPFWWSLEAAGTAINIKIKSNTTTLTRRTAITSRLQAAGIQVIPTITDGTCTSGPSKLPDTFKSDSRRAALVQKIAQLAQAENYDGIDLDLECFMYESRLWSGYKASWLSFIKDLSKALRAQGDLLSLTTPPIYSDTSGYWVYSWKEVAPDIDRLRIMAYDYSTGNSKWDPSDTKQGDGAIAPMDWVKRIVDYAASVVTPAKIWLGVPAYGRNWVTSVTGKCPTVGDIPNLDRATWTSAELPGKLAALGFDSTQSRFHVTHRERTMQYIREFIGFDKLGVEAKCTVTRTVWWQDSTSHYERLLVARKAGLAGIAIWRLNGEAPDTWTTIRPYAQSVSEQPLNVELVQDQVVDFGTPIQITATFKPATVLPGNRSLAEIAVTLEEWGFEQKAWVPTALSAVTDSSGIVKFSISDQPVKSYRVSTLGVAGIWSAISSKTLAPQIRPILTLTSVPKSPLAKNGVVVTGLVIPQPATFAPAAVLPSLKNGDTGVAVRKLQNLLRVKPATGGFYKLTEAAVKKAQLKAGLTDTGIVDESTWAALGIKTEKQFAALTPVTKVSASSKSNILLQQKSGSKWLTVAEASTAVDGTFTLTWVKPARATHTLRVRVLAQPDLTQLDSQTFDVRVR
jgi:spore germination protein YaaH/peptidoglycan hydrolase-like protein with peptidoglycan-binding domain